MYRRALPSQPSTSRLQADCQKPSRKCGCPSGILSGIRTYRREALQSCSGSVTYCPIIRAHSIGGCMGGCNDLAAIINLLQPRQPHRGEGALEQCVLSRMQALHRPPAASVIWPLGVSLRLLPPGGTNLLLRCRQRASVSVSEAVDGGVSIAEGTSLWAYCSKATGRAPCSTGRMPREKKVGDNCLIGRLPGSQATLPSPGQ